MQILVKSGFVLTKDISELNGIMIPRDLLINDEKYDIVKEYLEKLKKHKLFSSTFLTSLHKDAEKKQKWPWPLLLRNNSKEFDSCTQSIFLLRKYRRKSEYFHTNE